MNRLVQKTVDIPACIETQNRPINRHPKLVTDIIPLMKPLPAAMFYTTGQKSLFTSTISYFLVVVWEPS